MASRATNGRLRALSLVAFLVMGSACATRHPVSRPLDGVYAFKAYRGASSFDGTLSLASSHDGYRGYLVTSSLDLPLVASNVDGRRITLTFDDNRVMYVLTVVADDTGLRGSWRTLAGAGSIRATLVSTAWHMEPNGRPAVTDPDGWRDPLPPRPAPPGPRPPGATGDSPAPGSR